MNVFFWDWEFDLLYYLQGWHNPVLDAIMSFFSTIGDAGMVWIAIALLFIIWGKLGHRRLGIEMGVALLIMLVFGNGILKHIFMRARPCQIDETVDLLIHIPHDTSFPSGHTYASFAGAGVILYRKWKAGIAAMAVAVLVGFSRMYQFMHFPTDVGTSIILGMLTAFLVVKLSDKYFEKWSAWIVQKCRQKFGKTAAAETDACEGEQKES